MMFHTRAGWKGSCVPVVGRNGYGDQDDSESKNHKPSSDRTDIVHRKISYFACPLMVRLQANWKYSPTERQATQNGMVIEVR
jgi:hypothetical protein